MLTHDYGTHTIFLGQIWLYLSSTRRFADGTIKKKLNNDNRYRKFNVFSCHNRYIVRSTKEGLLLVMEFMF